MKNNVPIINYAMAAIMEPPTLIGAVIGVMLNHVVPNWLNFLLLISLLTSITLRTFIKGNRVSGLESNQSIEWHSYHLVEFCSSGKRKQNVVKHSSKTCSWATLRADRGIACGLYIPYMITTLSADQTCIGVI